MKYWRSATARFDAVFVAFESGRALIVEKCPFSYAFLNRIFSRYVRMDKNCAYTSRFSK